MTVIHYSKPKREYATFEPVVSTCRIYRHPNGYETRQPYHVVITVLHLSQQEVQLQAMTGKVSKHSIIAAAQSLADAGIETAVIHRAKGHRMPFGQLRSRGESSDVYIVDLLRMAADGLITPRKPNSAPRISNLFT